MQLATSIYSIQYVATDDEVVSFRNAIEANALRIGQRDALKESLKQQIDSNVPYIQYSAIADLKNLRLLTPSDLLDLGRYYRLPSLFQWAAERLMYQYVPVGGLRALVGVATAAKGLAAATAIAVLRSIAVLLLAQPPFEWSNVSSEMTCSNDGPVAAVAIRNHRAHQICRDLDHITSNPVAKIGPSTGHGRAAPSSAQMSIS
jgi:hypothetical protein